MPGHRLVVRVPGGHEAAGGAHGPEGAHRVRHVLEDLVRVDDVIDRLGVQLVHVAHEEPEVGFVVVELRLGDDVR